MFNFGDELTIQSYRIPWLIWIQLLIMFLIIVFLYCCSIIAFEFSDDSASASPSVGLFTSARSDVDKPLFNSTAGTITSSHHSKAGGSQSRRGERATSTSRRIARGEDILEREASCDKDVTHISLSETSHHPCHYIRLARQVFLKCLGLDSTSDDSPNPERRRDT
ncbi:hypothetical protein AAG906_023924 [Vitis piasezkii]